MMKRNKGQMISPLLAAGDILWEVDWLEENGVFAWHIHTQASQKQRAIQISEMFVEELFAEIEKGNNLLKTIRTELG